MEPLNDTFMSYYVKGYIDGVRYEQDKMLKFMEMVLRNEKGEKIEPNNKWERGYIYAMEVVKNYILTTVG